MKYIIDGHNLIPHIPGLSLSDMDDEQRLIELVQMFCRRARSQVELFFDGALPGQQTSSVGSVHTHFIRKGTPADDAIIHYLHSAGRNTSALALVTSDHRIQAEAHALGIQVIESAAFARQMMTRLQQPETGAEKRETALTRDEVDAWLKTFGEHPDKNS